MAGGRPSKYDPSLNEIVTNYCLLGATDKELAAFLDVCEATINNWKEKEPEFLESIKKGKEIADGKVAQSLYQRATGYSHEEDKIFQYDGEALIVPTIKHYAPDPTSMIFWLKNRRSAQWRDKVDQNISVKQFTVKRVKDES